MRQSIASALLTTAVVVLPSLSLGGQSTVASPSRHGQVIVASEVSVPQVRGRIEQKEQAPAAHAPALTKGLPEGNLNRPVGATAPETCDPHNATSPACHAATQQAHPIGR